MPRKKTTASKPQFRVLRDTREQDGWSFNKSAQCLGVVDTALKTGDYTIEGFEDQFVVERKGRVSELASNVSQDRFTRELERLEEFAFPFLICEFTVEELLKYPYGLKIPAAKKRMIRMKGPNLLRRICEIQIQFRTRFIFAGSKGKEFALSLFKRISETKNA